MAGVDGVDELDDAICWRSSLPKPKTMRYISVSAFYTAKFSDSENRQMCPGSQPRKFHGHSATPDRRKSIYTGIQPRKGGMSSFRSTIVISKTTRFLRITPSLWMWYNLHVRLNIETAMALRKRKVEEHSRRPVSFREHGRQVSGKLQKYSHIPCEFGKLFWN